MANKISGFVCDGLSNGEKLCTGCWDASGHDRNAHCDIPVGQPIFWQIASYEYDEWDAYCESCAALISKDPDHG